MKDKKEFFYKEMEIKALVALARGADDVAFGEIIERFKPMINRVISSYLSSSFSYGEAFSEASVALHKAVMTYNLDSVEVTFGLYAKICVNHALLDFSKRIGKQEGHTQNGVDLDSFTIGNGIEAGLILNEQMSRYFKIARSLLSEFEYEVLRLYIDGYTAEEIAARLSKSKKSVDNAKARAVRHLRNERGIFSDS